MDRDSCTKGRTCSKNQGSDWGLPKVDDLHKHILWKHDLAKVPYGQEDLPFKVLSRRFAFQSSVKKICLLKLRQKDLPFKAPLRRFAF